MALLLFTKEPRFDWEVATIKTMQFIVRILEMGCVKHGTGESHKGQTGFYAEYVHPSSLFDTT